MNKPTSENGAEFRYQDAMRRLEEIVSGLERDQISVDDLSEQVKEATILLTECRRKLTGIEDEVRSALAALENAPQAARDGQGAGANAVAESDAEFEE